jgi:hypothetical protein
VEIGRRNRQKHTDSFDGLAFDDKHGVHHYGGINDVAFRKKLHKIHEKYGRKPLLLMEFSVADWKATSVENSRYSPEQVLAFLQKILSWMESRDWMFGYSWFSFDVDDPRGTSSALFADTIFDGNVDWMDSNQTEPVMLELTPLGKFYAQFQSGATKSNRPFPEISSDILRFDSTIRIGEPSSRPTVLARIPTPMLRS